MKNYLRYPRTNLELNKLINFLEHRIKDLDPKSKQSAREWMRICQNINDIRREASHLIHSSQEKADEAKKNCSPISFLTNSLSTNFHTKVINTMDKWMRANKFPIW